MLRAELPRAGIGAEAVALPGNDLVRFSVALARSISHDALLICVTLRGAAQSSSAARRIIGHSPFYGNEEGGAIPPSPRFLVFPFAVELTD